MSEFLNPISPAADVFHQIFSALPLPIKGVFYISLLLFAFWALYRLVSR